MQRQRRRYVDESPARRIHLRDRETFCIESRRRAALRSTESAWSNASRCGVKGARWSFAGANFRGNWGISRNKGNGDTRKNDDDSRVEGEKRPEEQRRGHEIVVSTTYRNLSVRKDRWNEPARTSIEKFDSEITRLVKSDRRSIDGRVDGYVRFCDSKNTRRRWIERDVSPAPSPTKYSS